MLLPRYLRSSDPGRWLEPDPVAKNRNAYHDQGVLDTEYSITGEPLITPGIKSADQLPVSGGLDCNMEVVRPHVVTTEVKEQLSYRTLWHAVRCLGWNQSETAVHHPG